MTEINWVSLRPRGGGKALKIEEPEFYDGRYDLHPEAEVFLHLEDELEDLHWSEIDLDWATGRIKRGFIDWVSSAVVLKKVLRFRLYKDKFSDWKDYCIKVLGKEAWKVKKLIESADVVIELARAGFSILPTYQSQVEKLISCCKKLDCLVEEAWEQVVNAVPKSLITAKAIGETLGFPAENSNHKMPNELIDCLAENAFDRGLSINEMLAIDYGLTVEDEPITSDEENLTEDEDEDEKSDLDNYKSEPWYEDMQQLIKEHDVHNWLLGSLIKLVGLIPQPKPKPKSQFSYLTQLQYQT